MLLGLAVVETCLYYTTRSQIIITKTIPEDWRQDAMDLGPVPLPNSATEFEEFLNGRKIADVTYRIDRNRLREIPLAGRGQTRKVVFRLFVYVWPRSRERSDRALLFRARVKGDL